MNADNDQPTNIAQFPTPQPVIDRDHLMLLCECGCETFNLIANGTMQCAYCCEVVSDTSASRWREHIPEPTPESAAAAEAHDSVRNSFMGTAEFARRKVMKAVNHWSDNSEMAIIYAFKVSGEGKAWIDIDNEDQRGWVLKKIDQLREYIAGVPLDEVRTVNYIPSEEPENGETSNTEETSTAGETVTAQESPADTSQGGADGSGDASGG